MDRAVSSEVVGEALSEWLRRTGKTTVDLDKKKVVSRTTASNLLNGHIEHPHQTTVRRLARHFGVSVEEFLAGPQGELPKAPALQS